jgi:hypothetical protein
MMTRRTAADGTETWMELISKKLLRRAMTASKARAATGEGPDCSSIPKLALAAGVSTAAIGFLLSEGKSSRSTCRVRTAEAIAAALGWDRDELFTLRRNEKAAA